MISSSTSTPPPTVDPSTTTTTIKMEDLQVPFATPSSPSVSSPSPNAEAKPTKKRKSWGQVLPEPKTNLPPRKRAKTEDEKEQRRIERVKRNRLAAHNSRERKRQEYEALQAEKDQMEADLVAARSLIARMSSELKVYRQKYPGEIPESSLDIATPTSDYNAFISHNDTINPTQTTSSTGFPSPASMTMDSIDSPRDSSCAPETPNFSEPSADFDQTRYPAEILCDLLCQSMSAAPVSPLAIWTFLSLFNLTLPWMTSLLSLFLTSSNSTTPSGLLQAFWTMTSPSLPPSLAASPMFPALTSLISMMQSTSKCRQPLAQPLLATRLSQRSASIYSITRSSKGAWRASLDGGKKRRSRSSGLRQPHGRRKGTLELRREISRIFGMESRSRARLGCV